MPTIQAQQGSFSYLCKENEIPSSCSFNGPLKAFEDARDLVLHELASDVMSDKISNLKKSHEWIEDGEVYFELVGNASHLFPDVSFICSKVYTYENGLIFNVIYFEGTVYVTIQDSDGEQPLLDINFPDIRLDGNGAVLSLYDNPVSPWMKLSIGRVTNHSFHSSDHEIERRDLDCNKLNSEAADEKRCFLNENCLNTPEIENDQSICSASSSDKDDMLLGAVASAIDILDDAMIDICNTFNNVMVDIGHNDSDEFSLVTDKNANTESDRTAKLAMLENKMKKMDHDTPKEDVCNESRSLVEVT